MLDARHVSIPTATSGRPIAALSMNTAAKYNSVPATQCCPAGVCSNAARFSNAEREAEAVREYSGDQQQRRREKVARQGQLEGYQTGSQSLAGLAPRPVARDGAARLLDNPRGR
jgi:hypothetical protein